MNLQERMAAQRAARLERDVSVAAQQAANKSRRSEHRVSAPMFWDNVDTSGGTDACHPWTGRVRRNVPEGKAGSYEYGAHQGYEGCPTDRVHRVLVFATYGVNVPAERDVIAICDNHLCCNIKHLAITYHGGGPQRRLNEAIPVKEYFRCDIPPGHGTKP